MKSPKPWMEVRDWSTNSITSNVKGAIVGYLILFIVTASVSLLLSYNIDGMLAAVKREPPFAIFILFPILALGSLFLCLKVTIQWFINGKCPLVLDPFPGSIGGQVGGTVNTNISYQTGLRAKIRLKCVMATTKITSGETRTTESTLWEDTGICDGKMSGKRTSFEFCFDVPKKLPESSIKSKNNTSVYWCVDVISKGKSANLERGYIIPVFQTAEKSVAIRTNTATSAITEEAAIMDVSSFANINIQTASAQATYYGFKRPAVGLVLMLMGPFFGIVVFSGAPMFMKIIFFIVAFILLSIGLYQIGKCLSVLITPSEICARRYFFGVPVRTKTMSKKKFSHFRRQDSQGINDTMNYKLYACERGVLGNRGEEILVAESLASKADASAIQSIYKRYI